MRFFRSVKEMYEEVQRDLKEMGIKYISETVQDEKVHAPTIELNNYGYTLLEYGDDQKACEENDINMDWLFQEADDRCYSGLYQKNPGLAYKQNIDFWKKFIRDGRFSYTYAERLHPQMDSIIWELKNRPNTRQAILTMYDQHQDLMNLGGRDRIPCSMYYQFLLRENKLHMSYTMRSCDLIKFFLADVALAIRLLKFMAHKIKVEPGNFTHFIGSLHCFEEDITGVF